ncbi:SH3 domain-containing protein [Enterococcus cecorum]|uniref:SH3 domain-containing protein n=1 Tax=Enterococcus cecorum TaxID=44008 RepID=UPI003425D5F8
MESGSVSAKPTQPAPAKPTANTGGYKVESYNVRQVTDTALNVRTSPNTQSSIVRTLPQGYQFNATRIVRNGENINGYTTWCEVDGVGWVSMAYTTPVKAAPTAPQRVATSGSYRVKYTTNIRNAPSTSAAIVGTYAPGESFNYDSYIDTNGYRWYSYISYSGQRRYVAKLD